MLLKGIGTHRMEKTTVYFSISNFFSEPSVQNSLGLVMIGSVYKAGVQMAYTHSNSTGTETLL